MLAPLVPRATATPGDDNELTAVPSLLEVSVGTPAPGPVPQRTSSDSSSSASSGNGVAIRIHDGTDIGEGIVLTPSRLRIHSLSMMGLAIAQGLACLFVMLLLIKLTGILDFPWWVVFLPLFASSTVQIPISIVLLMSVKDVMRVQVGPPPAPTASAGLQLQYDLIVSQRARSHVCDHLADLLEGIAHVVVMVLFVWALTTEQLGSIPMRVVFAPAWVAWVLCIILSCAKDRQERGLVTMRDLCYIFLLMVALKVDGLCSYSWRVVFIFPWIYFAFVFMIAAILASTLMLAHAWSRWRELLLPLSFCGWLLCNIPMFATTAALVQSLDGDDSVSPMSILVPAVLGLGSMAVFTFMLAYGLSIKERVRTILLAMGAVWTAHDGVARRLHGDREAAQQHVDNLPEEEVARMVADMMVGKHKPRHLVRVGATLYRRIVVVANRLEHEDIASPGTAKSKEIMCSIPLPQDGLIRTAPDRALPGSSTAQEAVELMPPAQPAAARLLNGWPVTATLTATLDSAQCSALTTPNPQSSQQTSSLEEGRPSGASPVTCTSASQQSLVEEIIVTSHAGPQTAGEGGLLGSWHLPRGLLDRPSSGQGRRTSRVPSGRLSAPLRPATAQASGSMQRRNGCRLPIPEVPAAAALGLFANGALTGLVDGGLLGIGPQNQVAVEEAQPDDKTCVICYDADATCVFLECGHGGFCAKCARLLYVRPPNECPTCRQHIDLVVELEEVVAVGKTASVKQ